MNKKNQNSEPFIDRAIKNIPALDARPAALKERVFKKFFEQAEIEQLTVAEKRAYDESMKKYWDYHSTLDSARLQVARQKDKVIAEKDEVIAEKDEVIAEKNEVIAEKNEMIAEKEKALTAALARIAQLEKQK
jgi:uncharacterized protein (DUF3084 family)